MVAKFVKRTVRDDIFYKARQLRLTVADFGWAAGPGGNVFLTKHVSPKTARLLFAAKSKLSLSSGGRYSICLFG